MWSLVCLLGMLALTLGGILNQNDNVEFAPPVPDFPGIDPAIIQAALGNGPASSAASPSFSPPGPESSGVIFEQLTGTPHQYTSTSYTTSEIRPQNAATSSTSYTASEIRPQKAEPSSTSNTTSEIRPESFAPPPIQFNTISIPESAVIPLSSSNVMPDVSSASANTKYSLPSRLRGHYAAASSYSRYGAPGYSPPPVLSSYDGSSANPNVQIRSDEEEEESSSGTSDSQFASTTECENPQWASCYGPPHEYGPPGYSPPPVLSSYVENQGKKF